MRLIYTTLQVPSTVGSFVGTSKLVEDLQDKWVQVTGPFSGSFTIEASLDKGAHFVAVQTGITAPGLWSVPVAASHMRVVGTLTSGTPVVHLAGRNENG